MEDKVIELLTQLEDGVKAVFDSEKYKKYLRTMSSFHNYSFNNSMLIFMQNPDATKVAGFNTWKKLKRFVTKGEKGITILAPCGFNSYIEKDKIDPDTNKPIKNPDTGETVKIKIPVNANRFRTVHVFDISQTNGEPLQLNLIEELKGSVNGYSNFLEILKEISPYKLVFKDIQGGTKGYCDFNNKIIAIKNDMDEKHIVKTAIHEIAHSLLHGKDNKYNDEISRRAAEVQAESIAYVVCNHYDIDTSEYSFGYIASWSKDKKIEELRESLSIVQKTSDLIINKINDRHKELNLCKEAINERKSLQDIKKQIEEYKQSNAFVQNNIMIKKDNMETR